MHLSNKRVSKKFGSQNIIATILIKIDKMGHISGEIVKSKWRYDMVNYPSMYEKFL